MIEEGFGITSRMTSEATRIAWQIVTRIVEARGARHHRLWFSLGRAYLLSLAFPVMHVKLLHSSLKFRICGGFVLLPGYQILDLVEKSFLIEVVQDLGQILKNGDERVEFNVVPSDLPVFLHLQVVSFLCCFSFWINSFKVFIKLSEKHRPIIGPLGFFIVIII